jgi:hypothetical protein
MLRKIVYSWTVSGLWDVFSNGAVKASLKCPANIAMEGLTIKAVYNPEFHEIEFTAEPATNKSVSFTIEDAAPWRPNNLGGQTGDGSGGESAEPDGRAKQD